MKKFNCQKIKKFSKEKTLTKTSQKTEDNVVFLKQVPVHGRDRLARKTKYVKFVKQVLLHPQERLKLKRKSTTLDNYNHLSKKTNNKDVTFIKPVPLHWLKRLQRLAKTDDKVHFIKEVSGTKPKRTCSDKKENLQNENYK